MDVQHQLLLEKFCQGHEHIRADKTLALRGVDVNNLDRGLEQENKQEFEQSPCEERNVVPYIALARYRHKVEILKDILLIAVKHLSYTALGVLVAATQSNYM